ncbi:MAG: acyltransferase family protein [Steroidobacter sp.]
MSTLKYRPEIDGLRAIAVVSVLVFHVNSNLLPGGFVGVDIFFVISGYLITKIIHNQIVTNKFSVFEFYKRRTKRIIPVYLAVTIFSLIVGYYVQMPFEYKGLGNSSIAATLFLANVRYALVGNYFQPDTIKPLLHTWSLSVEEQYYFFWPLMLLLIIRVGKSGFATKSLILLLLAGSFLLATWMANDIHYATYAYYLLPSRAGELLTGSYLGVTQYQPSSQRISSALSITGMLLVLISILFINKNIAFPGISAAPPCLGAALIIAGANQGWVNKFLSSSIMVFIGLISYSLYMWHWPFLAFTRYALDISTLDIPTTLIIASIVIIVSTLSWRYIERPFRSLNLNFQRTFTILYMGPAILIILCGFIISRHKGYPERFGIPESFTQTELIGCHNSLVSKRCLIYNPKEPSSKVLLIGDSHAGHFTHFVLTFAKAYNWTVVDASAGSCKFYSKQFVSRRCEIVEEKIDHDLNGASVAFVACRFDSVIKDKDFEQEFRAFIKTLVDHQIHVYIFLQVPKFKSTTPLKQYAYHIRYGIPYSSSLNVIDDAYRDANKLAIASVSDLNHITLINLEPFICPNGKCSQFLDGKPIYIDDDHLNAYGSEQLAKKYLLHGNDKNTTSIDSSRF